VWLMSKDCKISENISRIHYLDASFGSQVDISLRSTAVLE
jgi:hypothetical protein